MSSDTAEKIIVEDSYTDVFFEYKNPDYRFYLYKKEEGKMAQIESLEGEHLTKDEVGKKHGGGDYRVMLHFFDNNGQKRSKTECFRIHSSYNRYLKKEEDGIKEEIRGLMAQNQDSMSSVVKAMQESFQHQNQQMMQMVTLLMTTNAKNQPAFDPSEMIMKQAINMSGMMNNVMTENFKNMTNMQNDILDQKRNETEEDSLSPLLELIKPHLDILPSIFGLPKVAQTPFINKIKKNITPEIQEMINDPEQVDVCKEYLSEQFDEKTVDEIMKTVDGIV